MLNPLASLPRDSRDTLFLLAVIAWIMLPQMAHLPGWCSALAAAVLLWRGWLALTLRPLPGKWWLFGLLLLTVAATLATYRTLLGRDAGVTLIVVLLALKTLELRARRDAFVVFFLGFFTMLTQFFFSQSLLTALAMLLGLLGLLTALVNSHMPVGRPSLGQSARLAGRMALLGAPIMLLLFLLFPRLAPLWGTPGDAMSGRSGLSGSMQVGSIARLALDDSVALRVRFEGAPPPSAELYFRGPVLSSFDGREWQALRPTFPAPLQPPTQLQVAGTPLRYEVTLEPSGRPWLPVLDATPEPPQLPAYAPRMTRELQWLANAPLHDIVRYRVQSYPQFRHGPLRPMAGLQDYLDLPAGFNPRTLQLAADLRRESQGDANALIAAALARLRSGGYRYTLEPGVFGQHSADEFWFDRKEGFCEHIASSFVVLMRASGIPARIVTGYQGGERNTVDDFWVVRQSDAHAWTEVWLAGQGWLRVDPTGAVAPGRIGTLQRLQAPRGVVAAAINTVSPAVALNLRAVWEAVNNRWNQWVLNYTQSRQLNLLRDLGFESPSWEDLGLLMAACLVLLSLVGAAWALWERRQHDPWLRLFEAAQQRLRKTHAAPDLTPRALAQAMARQHGATDPRVQAWRDWLLRLEALRYAPGTAEGAKRGLTALRREFKQLHWPL
ncbi:MAG: transglutaminase [Curvibacter sp. PD_MW3]|nr:MAG: transglutaminase [Curvibacter sp. PD_MW3]